MKLSIAAYRKTLLNPQPARRWDLWGYLMFEVENPSNLTLPPWAEIYNGFVIVDREQVSTVVRAFHYEDAGKIVGDMLNSMVRAKFTLI